MSERVAAVLAGGLGTRLRSVVGDRPKVLAVVRCKPFLAYLLDQLVDAEVGRVVLLTGYLSEQVEAAFGASYRGVPLEYSAEPSPLGTAGALRVALPKLFPAGSAAPTATFEADRAPDAKNGGHSPPYGGRRSPAVLVLNGDSYCDADLRAFRDFHEQQAADASLVLTRVADTSRFGKVDVDAHDRLQGFVEKQDASGEGWINAGIYLLNRELIEEIPAGRAVSIEREMFPAWLRTRTVCGFRESGSFLDVGNPESYRAADEFFARRMG